MATEIAAEFLNTWWDRKLAQKYSVQWKHVAAAQLLTEKHFPLVDLGAGSGVFLKFIEDRFPHMKIEGVEMSATAISNKVCSCFISRGNISNWVPAERVITVSLIDVIEHIPDPFQLMENIANHSDYVIISCPNFNFYQARWDVLLGRIPFQNRIGRGGHIYWCQFDSLVSLFRKAGMDVVRVNHLYPKNGNKWLKWMFSLSPTVFAHEFVFELRCRGDSSLNTTAAD